MLNESEAAILTGRAVGETEYDFDWSVVGKEFLAKGVKNVVITLGAKGAFYAGGKGGDGEMCLVGVEKIKVVDTTAAGDTFVGAYAVQVVNEGGEGGMEEVLKLACRAAGRTCEKAGAQAAIPWSDEVEGLRMS